MLSEVIPARQAPGEKFRRWFSDDYFDLIVWYEGDGSVYGFQLCYDKNRQERAVTWTRDAGPVHQRLDDGEERRAGFKLSPVLLPDGECDRGIVPAFRVRSVSLDPVLAAFIIEQLERWISV
jgi:hypothetical protein